MTSEKEFSQAFDLLWNNIGSDKAPGLNEYEKSVFLTKAQNELILNWYYLNSKGNNLQAGFDDNALRQMNFSNLLKTETESVTTEEPRVDHRALVFSLPDDLYISIGEQITLTNQNTREAGYRQVIPLHHNEYLRLMSKPFKEPLKWQAWRLLDHTDELRAEIVLTSADRKEVWEKEYVIHYIKKPEPIILTDLSYYGDEYKIEGKQASQSCQLHPSTHDAIIQRAVELAKIAWEGDINQTQLLVNTGQRSQ